MKYYDELKNTLELVTQNNDQINMKYMKNVTRYENALKGESIYNVYSSRYNYCLLRPNRYSNLKFSTCLNIILYILLWNDEINKHLM